MDLDSTTLRSNDPLSSLEHVIATQNAKITTNFVTIVMLDDLTSDPASDTVATQTVRHAVEGAITGQWRANYTQAAAGSATPGSGPEQPVRIKLLLANFGSNGEAEDIAVDAIKAARDSQHIVAVVDFGQSLDATRKAASDLSDSGITDVGSLVTGDNMNEWDHHLIELFHRIAPTNTEQANAAASLLPDDGIQVMLVYDDNLKDSYAQTLAEAFRKAYLTKFKVQVHESGYSSPDRPLNDISRSTDMESRLAQTIRSRICDEKPTWIYFAGRGVDMTSFLKVLSPTAVQAGNCGLKSLTVVTGDDATATLGTALPAFGSIQITVMYTGVATTDEWVKNIPGAPDDAELYADNYTNFVTAFTGKYQDAPEVGTVDDLADGYAMVNHDAVLTAATAARNQVSAAANFANIKSQFGTINCDTPVLGASGKIAFGPHSSGNPVNKVIPIIKITSTGSAELQRLLWSGGQQFSKSSGGCR